LYIEVYLIRMASSFLVDSRNELIEFEKNTQIITELINHLNTNKANEIVNLKLFLIL